VDLHILDIILRIIQIVLLPLVAFVVKILLDQRKQLNSLDRRITTAESCLEQVPSEKVLHELSLTIRDFGGDLQVAVEKIEGLRNIVDRVERVVARHEEYLLHGGNR